MESQEQTRPIGQQATARSLVIAAQSRNRKLTVGRQLYIEVGANWNPCPFWRGFESVLACVSGIAWGHYAGPMITLAQYIRLVKEYRKTAAWSNARPSKRTCTRRRRRATRRRTPVLRCSYEIGVLDGTPSLKESLSW